MSQSNNRFELTLTIHIVPIVPFRKVLMVFFRFEVHDMTSSYNIQGNNFEFFYYRKTIVYAPLVLRGALSTQVLSSCHGDAREISEAYIFRHD